MSANVTLITDTSEPPYTRTGTRGLVQRSILLVLPPRGQYGVRTLDREMHHALHHGHVFGTGPTDSYHRIIEPRR
jgi:hypothetical protein